jgi:hypothetical protein
MAQLDADGRLGYPREHLAPLVLFPVAAVLVTLAALVHTFVRAFA